jgi:hypothetical protein
MKQLLTSFALIVVLGSLMTLGPNGTRADGVPVGTDKVESLTPEQARALVEEFPGVDIQVSFKSSRHSFRKSLPLNGLKTLDAATARVLSNYHGPLSLCGLTTLDAEVLKEFKKPGTGGDYSSGGGGLFDWFRHHEGSVLHVDGLKTLDAKTATALVDVWGHRWSGILSHLEKLEIDTAKVLAGYRGDLVLNGLPALDAEVAKVLVAGDRIFLGLDGLEVLEADTAKALAEFKGQFLSLGGLTELDADTATAFAGFKHTLGLNGLTTLDTDAAKALADFKGKGLLLDGLTTLDAETAEALAGFKGHNLCLNGLTVLDSETGKRLAGFKGVYLCLNGLTSLDADTAKALAEFKGFFLLLNGLTALDATTAKALAEFKGQCLALNGLTTLDAAAAKALAEFKGPQMFLMGLTTLDAATAKPFAELKGRLYLTKAVTESFCMKNPFTPETASTWAALLQGDMSFVTALDSPDSVAIAQALAKRPGPLSIRNLKKTSPKTLTALLKKEDVQIPLIETLELIQEPDGSVTEDFIAPEWLSERESRLKQEQKAEQADAADSR